MGAILLWNDSKSTYMCFWANFTLNHNKNCNATVPKRSRGCTSQHGVKMFFARNGARFCAELSPFLVGNIQPTVLCTVSSPLFGQHSSVFLCRSILVCCQVPLKYSSLLEEEDAATHVRFNQFVNVKHLSPDAQESSFDTPRVCFLSCTI